MTRSFVLFVGLLALPLACDRSQQTTNPPTEASTAANEPAPAPADEEAEVASEDALEDEELWAELTDEELAEMDAELDAEVGLIGDGGGNGEGSGYGQGGGFGGRGQKVPQIRQAQATVNGNLDKDIVRRIVRAHINEVRTCYTAGLRKDETLAGQVSVAFTIGADGKVRSSQGVDSADFADQTVVECIAKAVGKWTFPKPSSGEVEVTYPFVLEPG